MTYVMEEAVVEYLKQVIDELKLVKNLDETNIIIRPILELDVFNTAYNI